MRTARRVAVAWLRGFEWMRMVLDADGEGAVAVAWLVGFERMRWCWGGRRGALLSPGWLGLRGYGGVWGWTARRFCCCLVEEFF